MHAANMLNGQYLYTQERKKHPLKKDRWSTMSYSQDAHSSSVVYTYILHAFPTYVYLGAHTELSWAEKKGEGDKLRAKCKDYLLRDVDGSKCTNYYYYPYMCSTTTIHVYKKWQAGNQKGEHVTRKNV